MLAVLENAPSVALGAGFQHDAARPPTTQAFDPAAFLDALQRGEVNGESLLVIIGIAIVAGLLLTLLVATLRGRRRRRLLHVPAAEAPPASPAPGGTTRSDEAWPLDDPVLRRAAMFAGPDAFAEHPTAVFPAIARAPISGGWPGDRPATPDETGAEAAFPDWPDPPSANREQGIADEPRANEAFRAAEPASARAMGLAAPGAATASSGLVARAPEWRLAVAPNEETAPADAPMDGLSSLGTPQAPLVVQLLSEGRRPTSGLNLSVVIAIATFAVGLAFAAGALVGDALGTTLGATIGVAFAGGAGTAIGMTAIFLRGQRR